MANLSDLKARKSESADLKIDTKNPIIVLSWDLVAKHGVGYRVKDVIKKMEELELPEEAGEIRSRSAIIRALREAAKGKDLRILRDTDSEIMFQLTKVSVEDDEKYEKIAKFIAETNIRFLKEKGEIRCDNKAIKAFVTEKFLVCQEHYRTNDITKILLRIFRKNGDIIALREKGGAYMIPSAYVELANKVREFLKSLNQANRVLVFKVSAQETQDITPVFIDTKAAELKAFRQEILDLEKLDEEKKKEGKKLGCESGKIKKERIKKLAVMKKKIALWAKTLQYEGEELNELIGKCDLRIKKYFGAHTTEK